MDMKKLIGSLLALTLIVSASQAQDGKEKKHGGKHHSKEMLSQQLNFSETQKKQLNDINAEFRKQMQELKKNDNITVKEFKSRKETIRKEQHQKVQSLLTPDQKAKLEQMKKDRITKGKERSAKGFENMKSKLNLSDEQVNKLKASHESFAAKAKEIRSNKSLTEDQKKEQFKALGEQRKEDAKSILTKDQLDKMQQMHKERGNKSVK